MVHDIRIGSTAEQAEPDAAEQETGDGAEHHPAQHRDLMGARGDQQHPHQTTKHLGQDTRSLFPKRFNHYFNIFSGITFFTFCVSDIAVSTFGLLLLDLLKKWIYSVLKLIVGYIQFLILVEKFGLCMYPILELEGPFKLQNISGPRQSNHLELRAKSCSVQGLSPSCGFTAGRQRIILATLCLQMLSLRRCIHVGVIHELTALQLYWLKFVGWRLP